MVGRRHQLIRHAVVALAASSLAACNAGLPFSVAPHQPAPQVVSLGGPVIASPTFVPIFFHGDDTMQAQVEQLDAALVAPTSTYWSATTSEYGVGPLTFAPSIVSFDTPPDNEAALDAWLASATDGTHVGWPTPDANTIYAVFLPPQTAYTTAAGASLLFDAVHAETVGAHGEPIVYTVVPRSSGGDLDHLTEAASAVYVDTSTDPHPSTAPGFRAVDPEHVVWSFVPGAELGDMCGRFNSAQQRLVDAFMIQRTWSNVAASAGDDPCVPAVPGAVYFGATAQDVADVDLDLGDRGGVIHTKGVQIPVGTSKTIGISFFSNAPTDLFMVEALAEGDLGVDKELTFSFDQANGLDGDVMQLTITHALPGAFGGSEYSLTAYDLTGADSTWYGYVAN